MKSPVMPVLEIEYVRDANGDYYREFVHRGKVYYNYVRDPVIRNALDMIYMERYGNNGIEQGLYDSDKSPRGHG